MNDTPRPDNEQAANKETDNGGTGLALGLAIGTGIGILMDNVGLGIALGIVFGMSFGDSLVNMTRSKKG